ncbi:UNVERIFIED_CONTAM: hypothetical protein NCL1_43362 [Trichonephila clavipes]
MHLGRPEHDMGSCTQPADFDDKDHQLDVRCLRSNYPRTEVQMCVSLIHRLPKSSHRRQGPNGNIECKP